MTELSFLIDLLLNGRLQKAVQEKVKARIAEVEQNMSLPQVVRQYNRVQPSLEPPVAITAEASKALADRKAMIQAAVNAKPMEVDTGSSSSGLSGTKGPRKF
jgi:hypothetical protein